MDSQRNRSPDRFATTRWSVVMRHATTESANALGELAERYWYPVYIYIRRCGHTPEAAQVIARRFLQQLLREISGTGAQPSQGHYRSYLLARLHSFLAADQHDEDDAAPDLQIPADLETRYRHDDVDLLSPEQSYQRGFALQVLHRTLRRLRSEARQTGHLEMYDLLEPYLARDPVPGEYEVVAARLRSRPLTAVLALKRLRQRFRELAGEELVDTVASADDLVAEQDALYAVMSGVKQ